MQLLRQSVRVQPVDLIVIRDLFDLPKKLSNKRLTLNGCDFIIVVRLTKHQIDTNYVLFIQLPLVKPIQYVSRLMCFFFFANMTRKHAIYELMYLFNVNCNCIVETTRENSLLVLAEDVHILILTCFIRLQFMHHDQIYR